eukprot:gene3394-5939_t
MESLYFVGAVGLYAVINNFYKPRKLNIIIAGPPGSGKGTVSESIIKEYDLVHVATGDLIRAELKKDNAWSKEAKTYVDNGGLVPQKLVNPLLQKKIESENVTRKGYILDGYPRSLENFETLKEMNIVPDLVLFVDVSDQLSIDRQSGRVTDPVTGVTYHLVFNPPPTEEIKARCTQRSTDNVNKAKDRLKTYHDEMDDFTKWYPNAVKIDGSKSITEVWEQTKAAIEAAFKSKL